MTVTCDISDMHVGKWLASNMDMEIIISTVLTVIVTMTYPKCNLGIQQALGLKVWFCALCNRDPDNNTW